jgi:Ca-activated chloride channel family protein
MEFANKEYFLLLLLIIPYVVWYVMFRQKSVPTMRLADTSALRGVARSWRILLMPLSHLLRLAAFVLLVIALARPQTHNSWKNESVEGIDIMLAIDVSTSMLAEDLKPNRIEAAKQVAEEFIAGRHDDNIGLAIFAGEAFTQCPMTIDHTSLLSLLMDVRTDIAERGMIEDGTAIGMGIVTAVSRLKDSKAKSKVVVLITDGSNNMGDISPLTAAEIAHSLGIRIYTVGVGTTGTARYPTVVAGIKQYINLPVEIDEKTLRAIARTTDGKYYRATNNDELRDIYKEIDQLEKTRFNVQKVTKRYDIFQPFALASFACLFLEVLLSLTLFRRIP